MVKNSKILVVDDQLDTLTLLVDILQGQYNVESTTRPLKALEIAPEIQPDLILLDVNMPKMDGYELCRRLMAIDSLADTPVIFLSAMHAPESRLAGLEAGAELYITKPYNIKEVLKHVNSQLSKAAQKKEILRRMRDMDDALNTVSHDLKNPISNIQSSVAVLHMILEDDPIEIDQVKQIAEIIESAADRMLSFVTEILDTALITESQDIAFDTVNLNNYLVSLYEDFELQANSKALEFTMSCPDDLMLTCSRPLLGQALRNLISNAIKYTPDEGRVAVTAYVDNNEAVIEVEDTGLGMSAEDKDRIFDRYFRIGSDAHQTQEGTGIGLSIVKNAIEKQNGSISVESELGEGTLFVVRLPLEPVGAV
ncbi:MAG: hybrid sensor histidine kinase/response regulator [Chloroflexota bacterium]